jgi:hypothetical protein
MAFDEAIACRFRLPEKPFGWNTLSAFCSDQEEVPSFACRWRAMALPMKILQLTTYPIERPLHGGQIRVAQIRRVYEVAGHDVAILTIRSEESYRESRNVDREVVFPINSPHRQFEGQSVPFIDDLLAGRFAANDQSAFERAAQLVDPDTAVLHLEQPWLYPLAERLCREVLRTRPKIVYSSQNIEWPLKQGILEPWSISNVERVLSAIKDLEANCAQDAAVTIAVSEGDAKALTEMGARHVVLAPNGIDDWEISPEAIAGARAKLPREPFALFIGSAHPPNATGFFQVFRDSLAFLPPDRQLVVAGSVCDLLAGATEHGRWKAINESRMRLLGTIDREFLECAKRLARVIVLPITVGGGSNLKTAEALRSDCYVVGTSTSFRGFEAYQNLPGVYVEDDPRRFGETVRRLVTDDDFLRSRPDRKDATNGLVWSSTLARLPHMIAEIQTL